MVFYCDICRQHVCACGCCGDSLVHGVVELFLHSLVGDEEEGCAGRGSHDCAADAIVDPAEAARGPEAGGGLQAGFERVEGEERGVDCCAC